MIRFLKQCIGQRSFIRLWYHYTRAFLAACWYGFPARNLTVIGITGTDGKTTTVGMVRHILYTMGIAVGSVSTTEFHIGNQVELNVSQKTSVSPWLLQKMMRQIVDVGCTHAVVEISSHGLVQGRVHHLFPSIAGITNTSVEHLDYHGTMGQYRKDKSKLFTMLGGKGTKVLNKIDETYENYSKIPTENTITFGSQQSDLWVDNEHGTTDSCSAVLHLGPHTYNLRLSIPGLFNVQNAQCAIGCTVALGIDVANAVAALADYSGEFGRMQPIDEGQPFALYADYTVSPASYTSVLSSLRKTVSNDGRVLVICGSCGDRMKEKRPTVGRICSELADVVVVTSDETYSEPIEQVMDDVIVGVDESACRLERIVDRREALEWILSEAKSGDCVAVCGMAGVTTMMTPEGQIPWDEVEIVREILRTRKQSAIDN